MFKVIHAGKYHRKFKYAGPMVILWKSKKARTEPEIRIQYAKVLTLFKKAEVIFCDNCVKCKSMVLSFVRFCDQELLAHTPSETFSAKL